MSGTPTEHFEHAEHAEHAALLGDPFLTKVSVTIAILAVIAATVGSLESGVGPRRFVRLGKVLAPPTHGTGGVLTSSQMQRLSLPQLKYP
jgi:hypothetical protein